MIRILPLLLFISLLTFGCSRPPAPPETSAAEPPLTVAFVYKAMSNPYFLSMSVGAKRAAQEENIQLLERACSNEEQVNEQIAIVDELVALKVSGICLAPISPTQLIPAAKKAQDAGIPVIAAGSQLAPEAARNAGLHAPVVKSDNLRAEQLAVEHLLLKAGRPLTIGVIEGTPGAASSEERKQGLLLALQKNADSHLVGVESGYWRADKGYAAAKLLFDRHPDLQMICAFNDLMALGALQYLQESGRSGILLLGFDGTAEAKTAIRSGTMTATIEQQSEEIGYQSVKLLVRRLRGESIPALTVLDTKLITAGDLP